MVRDRVGKTERQLCLGYFLSLWNGQCKEVWDKLGEVHCVR